MTIFYAERTREATLQKEDVWLICSEVRQQIIKVLARCTIGEKEKHISTLYRFLNLKPADVKFPHTFKSFNVAAITICFGSRILNAIWHKLVDFMPDCTLM